MWENAVAEDKHCWRASGAGRDLPCRQQFRYRLPDMPEKNERDTYTAFPMTTDAFSSNGFFRMARWNRYG
jgi:hypothetical protein